MQVRQPFDKYALCKCDSLASDCTSVVLWSAAMLVSRAAVPSFEAALGAQAAVHSYTQSLRFQLKDTAVKIIELEPPAVQTELHDYMGAHGRSIGITLPDFVRETMESLDAGLEDFAVANAKNLQGLVDAERFAKAFAVTNSIST